jgi:nucleoside-triphosphatase THEP1
MFDAQCDFAAIAYGVDDSPDRLLRDFAEDLRRSGHRVVGAIQHAVDSPVAAELGAVMLPGEEIVDLGHHHDDNAHSCGIDTKRLASIARAITAAIQEGVDLVIINRFGKLEVQGDGLIRLIGQAVDADIPVVTAVPEHRFTAWIKYSDGMSVRLPCRRAALDAWWQSVAGRVGGRTGGGVFCAVAK